MSNNNNPLAGHFRTPKLYTGLPSGGKFLYKGQSFFVYNSTKDFFTISINFEIFVDYHNKYSDEVSDSDSKSAAINTRIDRTVDCLPMNLLVHVYTNWI